ncbi:MAG: flagellar filament capping protein FliD [Pseudomonadota bacterium]|nr:flagellar filament capping protein FliD [Pseudomonadota bacterium]
MSDILTSLNTNGSGLNISALAKDLAGAEITPRKQIVEKRMSDTDVSISALAEARLMLQDLNSSLDVITRDPLLQTKSSSSGLNAVVADATKVAAGSESINVVALAREQVLEFKGFPSENATVQGGTVTIDFGVWTAEEPPVFYPGERPGFDMTVPEGGTLQDLAQQFDGIAGVTASVIDVGDGTFTLGILSDTGGQSGMRFTVNATGAAADFALSELDTSTDIETHQIRAASDAVLEYNGITVFRPTNQVDDLIDGVELELLDVTGGPASVTTSVDAEDLFARAEVFIAKVNETLEWLDDQTSRGVIEGTEAGALAGETSIEGIKNSLRSFLRSEIEGFGEGSTFLSNFGISMQRDGTLAFEEDDLGNKKIDEIIANDPMSLAALFESQVTTDNSQVVVAGRPPSDSTSGTYQFTRDPDTGTAYLGTTEVVSLFPGDGVTFYIVPSGPMSGLSLTVPDGTDEFELTYGRNFTSSLMERIEDALDSENALSVREVELEKSQVTNEEELERLDEKYATVEARYLTKFTAMEQMVTQLNSTGSYIEALLDAEQAAANG